MLASPFKEFYLKGIYAVEVVSDVKDGLVEVRAKTTFLHTSCYSNGRRQVKVGANKKQMVRRGEVLKVPISSVWSHRRRMAKGHL